jgi:hypothetical protein
MRRRTLEFHRRVCWNTAYAGEKGEAGLPLLFSSVKRRIGARYPGTKCVRFSFLAGLKVIDSLTFIVGRVSCVVVDMTYHRVLDHYCRKGGRASLSHFSACKNRQKVKK